VVVLVEGGDQLAAQFHVLSAHPLQKLLSLLDVFLHLQHLLPHQLLFLHQNLLPLLNHLVVSGLSFHQDFFFALSGIECSFHCHFPAFCQFAQLLPQLLVLPCGHLQLVDLFEQDHLFLLAEIHQPVVLDLQLVEETVPVGQPLLQRLHLRHVLLQNRHFLLRLLQPLSQRQRCLAFCQVRVLPHQLLHRDLQHLLLSPRLVRPYLQLV